MRPRGVRNQGDMGTAKGAGYGGCARGCVVVFLCAESSTTGCYAEKCMCARYEYRQRTGSEWI